ncbi:MAG: trypsin-like serine protease [Acidobacteriota bacterium]
MPSTSLPSLRCVPRALCLAIIFMLVTAGAASGQTLSTAGPSPALLEDASEYAQRFGVDLDEAVRRIQLQTEVGDLETWIAKEEESTFAGLFIQHEPEFRVVVRFTEGAGEARLAKHLVGGPLAELVDLQPAQRSLADLEADLAAAGHLARQLGIPHETDLNVRENRIEVTVREARSLDSALRTTGMRLPEGTFVREGSLATPDANVRGGLSMSTCTSGFTVRHNYSGQLGVATAAHCGNTQRIGGIVQPFRFEDQSGNQDVQWHSAACGCNVTNQFDSGIGMRAVTGTRTRNSQAIGSWVCKNGRTTGRTCGDIDSRWIRPSYVNSASSTFIRVDGNGGNLSDPGDSGGPWFVENLAYGIHSGGYDTGSNAGDSIYMAINYISSLAVSVLTAPPPAGGGALNVAPLNCSGNSSGSQQVSCFASVTGGTPPYTYNWTYSGMASSWSSGGNAAYAYYTSGCTSSSFNYFYVSVSDACGQSDWASRSPLSCF